jgi:hypothetical protein
MQNQIKTIDARPIGYASQFVRRVGDWLERLCPSCHHVGLVGIYPNREQESFRFIARRDWVCCWCAGARREVQDARLNREGVIA